MSNRTFEHAVLDWLEDGSDRTSPAAIDAVLLAVKTTPQERGLRLPWRILFMPALSRATSIAAVVLVAAVGVGGLLYLNSSGPGGPASPPPLTPAPTASPSPAQAAPGIERFTRYTSAVHGFEFEYPADWSVLRSATRPWRTGDPFPADPEEMPYAETFGSPGQGDAQIGLIVWRMQPDEGALKDIEEGADLPAFAQQFCVEVIRANCDTFTQGAQPRAWNTGNYYAGALLVPTPDLQFAFLGDCRSCLLTGVADWVYVIVVARPDDFPQAAQYGGSFTLLKSIVRAMGVLTT